MYENLKEVKKDSEEIFDGVILHLFKDTVILPNGQSATREVIRHNGAAAVVPINKNGEVLIEKQFRYPFDCVMTEIPAGKLDKGEEPETGARRELMEETGLTGGKFVSIGTLYPSVAYVDEVIHMYIATGFTQGKNHLDEDEFLETEWVHIDKLYESVMAGEIPDSKTQTAILKTYCLFHEGKLDL